MDENQKLLLAVSDLLQKLVSGGHLFDLPTVFSAELETLRQAEVAWKTSMGISG